MKGFNKIDMFSYTGVGDLPNLEYGESMRNFTFFAGLESVLIISLKNCDFEHRDLSFF